MRIVTESVGYWTVEALEGFVDCVGDEKIAVKMGEQRIVPPSLVYKERTLPPMVKEHAYELEMEKKLKRMVAQKEKQPTREASRKE